MGTAAPSQRAVVVLEPVRRAGGVLTEPAWRLTWPNGRDARTAHHLPRHIMTSSAATNALPITRADRSNSTDETRIDSIASAASAMFTAKTDCTTVLTESPRITASW